MRISVPAVAFVAVVVLSVALCVNADQDKAPPRSVGVVDVGGAIEVGGYRIEPTAWFNVRAALTTDDFAGRLVLLEFWATWCRSCVAKAPRLNALHERYAKEGLAVVAFTREEPNEAAFGVERHRMGYPVVAGKLIDGERPRYLPYAVLITPDGEVMAHGDLERVSRGIHVFFDRGKTAKPIDFALPGHSIGAADERPDDAFGPGKWATLHAQLQEAPPTQALLERCFAFYWANLPRDDWPGELRLIEENCKELERIAQAAKAAGDQETLEACRVECLKRLDALGAPGTGRVALLKRGAAWHAFDVGDQRAITALDELATRLAHSPMDAYFIREVRSRLDPAEPDIARPADMFGSRISESYEAARDSWSARLIGRAAMGKFAAAYEVEQMLDALPEGTFGVDTIRRLERKFNAHRTSSPADRAIQALVLDWVRGRKPADDAARNALHSFVYSILADQRLAPWARFKAYGGSDLVSQSRGDAVSSYRDRIQQLRMLRENERVEFLRAFNDTVCVLIEEAIEKLEAKGAAP